LKVVSKVGGDETTAAPKKTATAKKKEAPPSTNVSSPVRTATKKRKGVALVLEQEDEEEGEESHGPLRTSGYEKDDFVVSDGDVSDGEHFAPMQVARRRSTYTKARQQTLEELGGPIVRDAFLDEANLDEIHADIANAFVDEARRLEEQLRNANGLRRVLFTERHLRAMAVAWTDTLDAMRDIAGINPDNVAQFGPKFVPVIRRFHAQYQEMMGSPAGASPPRARPAAAAAAAAVEPAHDVVDLCSDSDFDDSDDDNDDAGEQSVYFSSVPPPPRDAEVTAWHAEQERLASQPVAKGRAAAPARGRNASGGSGSRGGARPWRGGGRRSFSAKGAGVAKRARKASGASGRSGAAARFGGARGGRGGGSHGGSGIGLMPM